MGSKISTGTRQTKDIAILNELNSLFVAVHPLACPSVGRCNVVMTHHVVGGFSVVGDSTLEPRNYQKPLFSMIWKQNGIIYLIIHLLFCLSFWQLRGAPPRDTVIAFFIDFSSSIKTPLTLILLFLSAKEFEVLGRLTHSTFSIPACENRRHFETPPLVCPRNDLWETTRRHHSDPSNNSHWFRQLYNACCTTNHIWEVQRAQYGISVPRKPRVSRGSFKLNPVRWVRNWIGV